MGPLIDETDTLEVIVGGCAEESRERELQARMLEKEEVRGIMDETLEIHGHRPGKKQEGVIRVLCENANGI